MSIRRPTVRRPKIPKIKKPSISKKKKIIKKLPTLGKKKTRIKTTKPSVKKKTNRKAPVGTCYLQENCKKVLVKRVTKLECRKQGGKSWRKESGSCENL